MNEISSKAKIGTLDYIFEQILVISKGECDITDEILSENTDNEHFNILSGLQMLHEDLALYKEEIKAKMEAELRLEALQKRNEELAQFNYITSHDLQEPLRTIQSFTDLLVRKKHDQLDEEGKVYLNFIQSSSTRMRELIHGLLNYSKVGKSIPFEWVNCTTLIEHVLQDLDHSIKSTSAIIKIDSLPLVYGNKISLRQLFQNLISNALKFKKDRGTPQLKISVHSTATEHVICFEDNGIGIEEAFLKKVFGIFQRLHNRSKFEGTGIGLALCKRVVEMHSGKIWVESEEGVGAKFYVRLPIINK